MKKVLGLLFITSSVLSMQLDRVDNNHKSNKMYIDSFSVKVPNRLGNLNLYHGKKGFYVRQDDKKQTIKKYFTDPMLRDITKTQLKAFLANGYLSINQMDDGEFSLKANGRIVGGGVIGASIGAFLGKAAVYVVGHGAIQIVAICTGPAYPITVLALEGCFAVPIEAASMAGAVAGGIALGVATGPV